MHYHSSVLLLAGGTAFHYCTAKQETVFSYLTSVSYCPLTPLCLIKSGLIDCFLNTDNPSPRDSGYRSQNSSSFQVPQAFVAQAASNGPCPTSSIRIICLTHSNQPRTRAHVSSPLLPPWNGQHRSIAGQLMHRQTILDCGEYLGSIQNNQSRAKQPQSAPWELFVDCTPGQKA